MKLLKKRCLECSICAILFSSSLTVSIKARFLNRILSAMLIREFFILFFTLVISCMPPRKRVSNNACPIYPLSAPSFPFIFSKHRPCFNGSPVICISRSEHKIEDFTFIIDYQMQFETEKPSHRTFPSLGETFKCLMNQYTLVATHTQGSRIHKTDSRASP